MAKKFTQGIYKVKNKDRYKGNAANVTYRSSWELTFMFRLDMDDNVLEWSSEETIIPYRDVNNVIRRYYVDFKVKRKRGDKIVTELIEIKPHKETIPPVLSEGKKSKTKVREILTYDVNQRKWAAARTYCKKMGWDFVVMTEYELGLKKR